MSSTTIYQYHYLYRITNLVEQKHYYGIRTSRNTLPHKDLGVKYFSSSRDKEFKKDQRLHPENYKYKVIITSDSRQRILELEVKIHQKFNVSNNPKFYNNAIQTNTGFDVSGKVSVRDDFGNTSQVSVDDPRIKSGEIFSIVKGTTVMCDSEGNCFRVLQNDPRIETGELVSPFKGMRVVRDQDGNCMRVYSDDPRIETGELVSPSKGSKWAFNIETNQIIQIKKNQELPNGFEYGKGGVSVTKNTRWIHNKELNISKRIKRDESLPMGWVYGRSNEKVVSSTKDTRWIHNLELKKNKMLKPCETLPRGWAYGIYNPKPSASKGSNWIHNLELKKNKMMKPGEILPKGWEYGMKRSWD